jgi:hypothetical protein
MLSQLEHKHKIGVYIMAITNFISDNFEMSQPDGSFRFTCSILMPADEYNSYTAEQIQQMKQDRYDKWYAFVIAASQVVDDTDTTSNTDTSAA